MLRRAGALVILALLVGACGRHHVIARNTGRIDEKRSTSSTSDTQWTVQQEPQPADSED